MAGMAMLQDLHLRRGLGCCVSLEGGVEMSLGQQQVREGPLEALGLGQALGE